ncbi:MAG TPA: hypothetical protein VGB37_05805 [Candidatus Lokiarchaeia archaeon]
MNNERNLEKEKEKPRDKTLSKGWNDLFSGLKDGFEKFKSNLEEQSKKSVENWDKAKGKVDNFLNKMKDNWDEQVKSWNENMAKIHQANKEQWDANAQKVKEDFEKWQNGVREDWKDGVKSWNRGIIKGAWMFMVIMIPILIVLFVIAYIFTMVMKTIP